MNYEPVDTSHLCDHDPRYDYRGEVTHVTCSRCDGWAAAIGFVPVLPPVVVRRG